VVGFGVSGVSAESAECHRLRRVDEVINRDGEAARGAGVLQVKVAGDDLGQARGAALAGDVGGGPGSVDGAGGAGAGLALQASGVLVFSVGVPPSRQSAHLGGSFVVGVGIGGRGVITESAGRRRLRGVDEVINRDGEAVGGAGVFQVEVAGDVLGVA